MPITIIISIFHALFITSKLHVQQLLDIYGSGLPDLINVVAQSPASPSLKSPAVAWIILYIDAKNKRKNSSWYGELAEWLQVSVHALVVAVSPLMMEIMQGFLTIIDLWVFSTLIIIIIMVIKQLKCKIVEFNHRCVRQCRMQCQK